MKYLIRLLFLLLFVETMLSAQAIDVRPDNIEVLSQSMILLDREGLPFSRIKEGSFTPAKDNYVNLAFDAKTTVWVKMVLENPSDVRLERYLEIDNPLLEEITLYIDGRVEQSGMLHIHEKRHLIKPSFKLEFAPHTQKELFLKVRNSTTSLQFSVALKSFDVLYDDDQQYQYTISAFLGVIIAFLIYAVLLFLYTRDQSYILYSLYLSALLFQQMTYLGFIPLHAPAWFITVDNKLAVAKVAVMIITAICFAQSFLKTSDYPRIDRIYNSIIIFVLIQIPLFGTPWFYYPEVTIITGLFFVIFNTYVGVYTYIHGNKQARFFVIGWGVLVIAYLLFIFDVLGLISVMHAFPNMIMWATAFEALFLLLAIIDRLSLLQQEKEILNDKLIESYALRQEAIEETVEVKTAELTRALAQKELLFKELHHRVKNNLQLILSLIRLQGDKQECGENNMVLEELERRILAIARTHELLLYTEDDVEIVDMEMYVSSYIDEIENGVLGENIEVISDIDARLPLREAIYVGLVINELVSNAIKYAFGAEGGVIEISLKKDDGRFIFEVSDNGKGYNREEISTISLGLTLVNTLIEEQLEGTIEYKKQKGTHYIMRFGI